MCSEGEPVKLRCKLAGQPLPQVTWYFGDKELEAGVDDRYTVISDYNEFILMAARPTLDMSGRYTAVAKNQHGTKQMTTRLVVEGQLPAAASPWGWGCISVFSVFPRLFYMGSLID